MVLLGWVGLFGWACECVGVWAWLEGVGWMREGASGSEAGGRWEMDGWRGLTNGL